MKLVIADNFSLPLEAVTQTFAILAKRGVGKTYTAAVMTEEMLKAQQQVVVADPVGVWWGLRSSANGKEPGFPIVVFGGEHAVLPLQEESGEIIASAIIEHGFSAVLDLSLLRKAAQVRFMTAFAEALYRLNRKPLHFMVDEADAFAPQRPQDGEQRLLGAFEDIVRRGRARGLGATLITQRAAVLNKNVLTQIEVMVALRTISPQDRDAMEAWIEVHGTEKQHEQFNESIASLPIGTAWFWSPGWLDIFKRVEVRKRETFDSSATPKVGEKAVAPKALAEVDLPSLGAQIEQTVERAKANDPSELKRQIAALKKEKAELEKVKPHVESKPARKVEVSVVREKDFARFETAGARITAGMEKLSAHFTALSQWQQEVSARLKVIAGQPAPSLSRVPSATSIPRPIRPVTVRPEPRNRESYNGRLPIGERKILEALIQYQDGLERSQLTVITGYKRSSRDAYIARLREKGLVSSDGERVQTTSEGVALLPDAQPLPSGDDLQQFHLNRLPQGERALLEILIGAYPHSISKDVLTEKTGYMRSSRDAYLARMRAKQIITEPTRGEVRASDTLFDN